MLGYAHGVLLLFRSCNLCWSLVYIFKEYREGNKEGDAEQIFYTFDVGVVVNQGMQRFYHPDGYHVFSRPIPSRPVS